MVRPVSEAGACGGTIVIEAAPQLQPPELTTAIEGPFGDPLPHQVSVTETGGLRCARLKGETTNAGTFLEGDPLRL